MNISKQLLRPLRLEETVRITGGTAEPDVITQESLTIFLCRFPVGSPTRAPSTSGATTLATES